MRKRADPGCLDHARKLHLPTAAPRRGNGPGNPGPDAPVSARDNHVPMRLVVEADA